MTEAIAQIRAQITPSRINDSDGNSAARSSDISRAQQDLVDLIDLSDTAIAALNSSKRVLDALDIYKQAFGDFLGLPVSGFNAEEIFEKRSGDDPQVLSETNELLRVVELKEQGFDEDIIDAFVRFTDLTRSAGRGSVLSFSQTA